MSEYLINGNLIADEGWTFHLPRFALNPKTGRLYALRINLDSICLRFAPHYLSVHVV